MTSMLADLLGGIADEIRAAMPSGWAAANDEDSQFLFRELSAAGLLDEPGLIALLLQRADQERIANAVRARSGPGGAFLQALIADEDEFVSASAMALILARGRRRDRLGQPRVEFEDLPAGVASTIAQAVAAVLRRHSRGTSQDSANTRFSSAAADLLQRRDEAKAISRVTMALGSSLMGAGKLEERLLEAAAEEGDVAFIAGALAERAGVDPAMAWDHLVDGNHGRLVLLLKMADSSRQFAASLLALLGDLVGIVDLGGEIARFDGMTDDQMRAGREALQLDPAYRSALAALGGDNGQRAL